MKISRKGQSVQDLIGIKSFTDYGLATYRGELLFFQIAPTNISVLSKESIETKIHHLMIVLFSVPDIEIVCTDASECFDDNKRYMQKRQAEEENQKVRSVISKDVAFLDRIQTEMATARQFVMIGRCRNMKPENVFNVSNDIQKAISGEGFEVRRMKKNDIKRFLALYFGASLNGEQLPDQDGEQYVKTVPLPVQESKTVVREEPLSEQYSRQYRTDEYLPDTKGKRQQTDETHPKQKVEAADSKSIGVDGYAATDNDASETDDRPQPRIGFGGYIRTEDDDE